MPYVDLTFRLNGTTAPVDHGYALYSALSRVVSEIHSDRRIGVQPIRGIYAGNGTLHLASFSRLILRLPDEQIRTYLTIAGKKLEIDSYPISAGVPQTRTLRPVASLRARLVTIKGFLEDDSFLDAAKRQLEALGIVGHIHNRRALFAFPSIGNEAFVFDEIHQYDDRLFGALSVFSMRFEVPQLSL